MLLVLLGHTFLKHSAPCWPVGSAQPEDGLQHTRFLPPPRDDPGKAVGAVRVEHSSAGPLRPDSRGINRNSRRRLLLCNG